MRVHNWEKEKIIYQENCINFRHLNEILWKVPVLAMSMTGGLWFGIASLDISNNIRIVLLVLSTLSNLLFIFVLFRLRSIMAKYLKDICQFEGRKFDFGHKVVLIFSIILLVSSVSSVVILSNMDSFFGSGVDSFQGERINVKK